MNKRIVGAVLGIVAVAFSSSVSGFAGPIGAVGDLYLTSPNSGQVQQFDGTTYAYVGPFTQAHVNAPVRPAVPARWEFAGRWRGSGVRQ
jgi:hypothetical protein